jgi:chromosome segregation ATPase
MPQRRRRAETEGDEDVDNLRESPRSTPFSEPGKRARTNGYQASESPEPYESDATTSQLQSARTSGPADERDSEVGPSEFQPGAIIRVKLTNFVTYENAEFFPGPNLNMVIGPNGTGKSSLVCAICLGLGYGAKHLGRAGEVGEFVKHNTTEAYIEIELQRRKNEMRNHIIRVRIAKDNNNRDWWLNNKKTSMKAIQDLTRSLSIQIDNLCQFLPQDKVSEFAALTPVELLQQTQRAAAPEQMLDWHNELKRYRKEQKELEMQNANDKEQLETLETRQDGLRAEVRKLEERKEIQDQVAFLNKSRPFVEYRNARREHFAFKERKLEAQERYKRLEARLAPTLQNLNRKNRLRNQIDTVAKERKQALQAAEKLADKCSSEIAVKDEEIVKIEQKRGAEVKAEKDIKNEISKLERKLNDLRARANDEPVQFNGAEYNDRVVSFTTLNVYTLTNPYIRELKRPKFGTSRARCGI